MTRGRYKCGDCEKVYLSKFNECPKCGCTSAFASIVPYDPRDWVYDIETYPNIFTATFKHVQSGTYMRFEISTRKNDLYALLDFLFALKAMKCRLIGFNNESFDYTVLHEIMIFAHSTTLDRIYQKAQDVIHSGRFENIIWASDRFIEQIDLYKINHFDNVSRATSLKQLEFNMDSESVEDLPFEPGEPVPDWGFDPLIQYNDHDVDETEKFYFESLEMIEFREELTAKYDKNFMNHNDTKIGKDYFIMCLEKQMPGSCYSYVNGSREINQTHRDIIHLREVIFPYIQFDHPEFQRVCEWLKQQSIYETKGVFKGLHAVVDGFKFGFGTGGIHGSIPACTVESDEEYEIWDWDVASYYPNLAIVNRLYPEHLSELFCEIYQDVYNQRKSHAKGTAINAMLKLALNGVYGDSNSPYSPFYDPYYTMGVTINGQLLLCLLSENLMKIPGLQMIQANTDGVTVRCPRKYIEHMKVVCSWWEKFTGLTLESVIYNRMFIRDVNNYIGEYQDGSVKRKGAYEYKLDWAKDFSMRVVAKAAEAALTKGADIENFIKAHNNVHDFMLCAKVSQTDKLMIGEERQQRVTRYYVSTHGHAMTKISPPAKGKQVGQWARSNKLTDDFYYSVIEELRGKAAIGELDSTGLPWDARINTKSKSKYNMRNTAIQSGYLVTQCNNIKTFDWSNLNYQFYIDEAKKLVDPLMRKGP